MTAPKRRWWRWPLAGIVALIILLPTLWAAAALFIDSRPPWLRAPLAVAFLLAVLGIWLRVKGTGRKLLLNLLAVAIVLGWWLWLPPSNNRAWQPDVAVLPYAEFDGDRVTIHNIRNCEYRTETDYAVRHYDKTFDLTKLRTVDLYMVYWGSPAMAHTMMSFGFTGGDYVCFSIETRKEVGEGYSAVEGLFRQFELTYVVADERDLVRLRTNYRVGEDVYLYRLRATAEQARTLFLEYLRRVNSLRDRPEWYNAVTANCTTAIRAQRTATERAPWDWRMLANGYGDQLLYARGAVATNLPLAELKSRGHVNARAKAADPTDDFSTRIREGIPGIE